MIPVTEKNSLMPVCFPEGLPDTNAGDRSSQRQDSESEINSMTSYHRLVSKNGPLKYFSVPDIYN